MKRCIPVFLLLALVLNAGAQESLTLEAVIGQALQNNHRIQMIENQQVIAENSVSIGNAGLLPSVNLGGSLGGSINNTELEFAGEIPPAQINGAQSSTLQGNATLNYVLFNGLSGQRNFQKLKLNKDAVDLQSRASIEATILQVAQMYFSVLRAKDQVRIATDNAAISAKRYERALIANELGSISRNDLLAARVDLTSDSSDLLNAELQSTTSLRNLGRLMGAEIAENPSFPVIEPNVQPWSLSELEQAALTHNANVKNLELQAEIAQKDLQLSWSSMFPTVSINGGYSYTNQQNEAGILLKNVSNGWNGNIGLSYTIFNGFRNNTNRQNAQVLLENSELQLADQKLQLTTDLHNAHAAYLQSVKVLRFEEGNLSFSLLNLERAEDLMHQGLITSTQFREAQLGHASALVRISNAKFAMKLNELEVLRLTGQILSGE
ncbi:MAG: TolC family protein [Flavobacteriales bacterium]|nr:TolC family protein [Flavobacteriales bacterium]